MCEWRPPPQRTMAASATCCRDAMGLSSPLISECAIQQIRVGLKTPCPRTGHWRKACANLTLSSLLKWSQPWTKAAEASWLCSGLPLYPPLWCWPTYFHSMSKSASYLISTTTCAFLHLCHAFYLSHQYWGLLFSFRASGLAHLTHLSVYSGSYNKIS